MAVTSVEPGTPEEARVDEAVPATTPAPSPNAIPPADASITGFLRPHTGTFEGDPSTLARSIHIDVVARDSAALDVRRATVEPVVDPDGHITSIEFRCEGLAPGRYVVTLSSLDHRRWHPAQREVSAPASNIEFFCYNDAESRQLIFEVVDAATGEPIEDGWKVSQIRITPSEDNGVLLHAGPLDTEHFASGTDLDWAVEAEGFATAYGTQRDFSIDPRTGARRARVELERGFATRIIVLGVSSGPKTTRMLADRADVTVDGKAVGRTNDLGVFDVRGAKAPETIRLRWGAQGLQGDFEKVLLARRPFLHVALLKPDAEK